VISMAAGTGGGGGGGGGCEDLLPPGPCTNCVESTPECCDALSACGATGNRSRPLLSVEWRGVPG
jgi:hypothetical protein